MEAPMPGIDQETQKIVSNYTKIYNVIFRYGIFGVLIVVSFVFILLLKPESFANNNDIALLNGQFAVSSTLLQSGNSYIAKGITLDPTVNTDPIKIRIIQGFISATKEAQMAYGVLGEHNGFILPISINMVSHEEDFNKTHFTSGAYDPNDLNTFIKNNILTYPLKNIQTTLYQYKQNSLSTIDGSASKAVIPGNIAAIDTTLRARFGLGCLSDWHITNFFCYKNEQQFIARIPYMSFDKNLEELTSIMGDIAQTPYKKNFCDNLQYAFSKTVTNDRQWELIFSQCGDNYLQAYHRINDFSILTYELHGISNTKLYADDDMNIFKLVSLMQKIYQNTLQKNYDVNTIDVYLSFVQDLLNKRRIDVFYKDLIYLYNNTYLMSVLTQIAIINNDTKAMLRLADVIKSIDGGSIHLERQISNPDLITYVDRSLSPAQSQQNLVTFQDLFANKFTTFDNFIVTNQTVDNESLSATVEGYFMINDNFGQKRVLFAGEYTFDGNNFILMRASFAENAYLEPALNQLIAKKTISIDIPFVYEYIKNNSSNGAVKSVGICDIISTKISPISCSAQNASFMSKDTSITFSFNGYKISSISSDDASVTDTLRTRLGETITTQENIGTVIRDLIKSLSPDSSSADASSGVDTTQFTIIGKFKQFFGVIPDNISPNGNIYIVEFKLENIALVAGVDTNNNYKMFPIGVKSNGKVTRVNNFSLNLTNVGLSDINIFKADPWAYIKKLDPAAYEATYPKPKD